MSTETAQMEDDHELRDMVANLLEKNGTLAKLRAQLRASVFLALDDKEDSLKNQPLMNQRMKKFISSEDGRLCLSMVWEFLEFFNLDYSLSVFSRESYGLEPVNGENGTKEGPGLVYKGRSDLRSKLGLSADSSDMPVIGEVLTRLKDKENKTQTPAPPPPQMVTAKKDVPAPPQTAPSKKEAPAPVTSAPPPSAPAPTPAVFSNPAAGVKQDPPPKRVLGDLPPLVSGPRGGALPPLGPPPSSGPAGAAEKVPDVLAGPKPPSAGAADGRGRGPPAPEAGPKGDTSGKLQPQPPADEADGTDTSVAEEVDEEDISYGDLLNSGGDLDLDDGDPMTSDRVISNSSGDDSSRNIFFESL